MAINDNSKTFLRQMAPEEIPGEFWSKFKKSTPETFLWRSGQSEPYTVTTLFKLSENNQFKCVVLDVDPTYFEVFKEKFKGATVFLKFKFSVDAQFFTSGPIEFNDGLNKFVVLLGQPFFVTTKRATCRYSPSDNERINVSFSGHVFDCYDVSSGGFSALVKVGSVSGMEKGMSFEKAELKYNVKRFPIPKVTLVNIIENKDQPDWIKYAFKFEGLRPSEEDAIWVEVNRSVQRLAELLGS